MFMCLVSEYHMCVSARGGQGGDWVPLELELELVVSHLTWVLGPELWSSAGALNGRLSSPSFAVRFSGHIGSAEEDSLIYFEL